VRGIKDGIGRMMEDEMRVWRGVQFCQVRTLSVFLAPSKTDAKERARQLIPRHDTREHSNTRDTREDQHMLSLLAPAASCYLTAFGQQSLYDLYNPFGPAFGRHHHPLGLAPLLDHASLLNRASLLNHPSPLLRTPRFDFSHALQQLDMSHLDTERLLHAKMVHDTKAHAKRVAVCNANRLA